MRCITWARLLGSWKINTCVVKWLRAKAQSRLYLNITISIVQQHTWDVSPVKVRAQKTLRLDYILYKIKKKSYVRGWEKGEEVGENTKRLKSRTVRSKNDRLWWQKASTLDNNEMRMIGNRYARGLPRGLGPWREYDNNVQSQPL